MKRIFLTLTLAIGVLGAATEIREQTRSAAPVIAPSPDMPPPACWPDCDALSVS